MFEQLAIAISLEVGRARTGFIPSYYLALMRKAEQVNAEYNAVDGIVAAMARGAA